MYLILLLLVFFYVLFVKSKAKRGNYEQAEDGATLKSSAFTILTLADSATYHLPRMTQGDVLTYMAHHPLSSVTIFAENGGKWLLNTSESTMMHFFVKPDQSVGLWLR